MSNCDKCGSERIFAITAKSSDRSFSNYKGKERDGYAPHVANICGGDYVEPVICLECGKAQGDFPVPDPDMGDEYE